MTLEIKMRKLLFVDCCIRNEDVSRTKKLCRAYLDEYLANHPGTQIEHLYLPDEPLKWIDEKTADRRAELNRKRDYTDEMFRELVFHELSHCLSRLFPEYRQVLYSLIHFTVLDEDIEVPEEIREQIIANPDVEHHNSCATFTINGEPKDCYLVFLTDSVFEKAGDNFFSGMYTGVVPLDGSRVYRTDEVDDFWQVVGENTDYVEDPEEAMASNFAFAITHLDDGYDGFKNPEILEGIVDYLKTGAEAKAAA